MINYPETITVSQLQEIDGLVMSKEICNRYNSHNLLLNEIEHLQAENKHELFVKRVYAVVSLVSLLTIMCIVVW